MQKGNNGAGAEFEPFYKVRNGEANGEVEDDQDRCPDHRHDGALYQLRTYDAAYFLYLVNLAALRLYRAGDRSFLGVGQPTAACGSAQRDVGAIACRKQDA